MEMEMEMEMEMGATFPYRKNTPVKISSCSHETIYFKKLTLTWKRPTVRVRREFMYSVGYQEAPRPLLSGNGVASEEMQRVTSFYMLFHKKIRWMLKKLF